ncbi:hypothetical protein Tamer19_35610 [Cupriavidus sp. TA19]|uniref:hypothetical protein n=1 Tax=unclassified Cupriavidus TaxID=2640874 RepID=UPI000E2E7F4E|nr:MULTISPECIES: hypothetical protein [unclassified Cupriavidus]BDB22820.1 hypothetical protein CTP10_R01460 [Cupriavidus sp. P-10]GLC94153.1 hypothetical protein Tamer19_35610 [Cupriavidus sp. TA19]
MVNYKTRRVVLATGGLLAALAAATAFLCIRPAVPSVQAAEAAQAAQATQATQANARGAAAKAAAATLALDAGALFSLSDRHAGDAMRIVAQGDTAEASEGLDWEHVQLRL